MNMLQDAKRKQASYVRHLANQVVWFRRHALMLECQMKWTLADRARAIADNYLIAAKHHAKLLK